MNQTRSQIEGTAENMKHHSQTTSYKEQALVREFYQVTNIQIVK